MLLAAVTSGVLAVGSFITIKEYRQRTFTRHADETARLGLLLAPRDPSVAGFEALLDQVRLGRTARSTSARPSPPS